jgi:hypothetical protein
MDKQELIDSVLDQIEIDVKIGDLTAIEELLQYIPEQYLMGYLPEIVQEYLRG